MAVLCSRIYCICRYSTNLREVVARDLLPSSAMIKHLSQEFGLPISQEELTDRKLLAIPPHPAPNLEGFRRRHYTLAFDILSHQQKHLQWWNTVMLKNRGQKHSLIQVALSLLWGQGSQAFAPPELSSHMPGDIGLMARPSMGHLPLACFCSPALESQAGWAGSAGCRAALQQKHSFIALASPTPLKGEKECS